MVAFFATLSPVMQALVATLFTWGMTALGAALVFTTKTMNQNLMDGMLGFAGGVMIAASFWSLLSPALEMSEGKTMPAWFSVALGFVGGALFLWSIDKLIPHLHPNMKMKEAEGIHPERRRRSTLLVLAITLHNIPEGLAVGVAFGAVAAGFPSASLAAAVTLAIGIGIQNFPEGTAVAMPLRREGMSRKRSFMYGQLSGIVEPIAAVIGVLAVTVMQPLLPFALSFAAGAMVYVVVEELIPEMSEGEHSNVGTIFFALGFSIMMILDVALG